MVLCPPKAKAARSNRAGRAISEQNSELRLRPIFRWKRRPVAQQFRLRSHDVDFPVRDLDALGQGAQVVAAVTAAFQSYALAGSPG